MVWVRVVEVVVESSPVSTLCLNISTVYFHPPAPLLHPHLRGHIAVSGQPSSQHTNISQLLPSPNTHNLPGTNILPLSSSTKLKFINSGHLYKSHAEFLHPACCISSVSMITHPASPDITSLHPIAQQPSPEFTHISC